MYLRIICLVVLALVGRSVVRGAQVGSGSQTTNPWIHGNHLAENDKHQQQNPQYSSEYPSEYVPYYPSQYTPPYPTQSRPQAQGPTQSKPPFTLPNKPQPPTSPVQHHHQQPYPVHHNQISNPSIKPTPGLPTAALDQYNHRYPDGSYEFRYELPDETVRYEKGYFIHFHHKKSLVVRGYYSYRLPGKGYLTVFYTADHFGYRQDSAGITPHRPQLPHSLGERRILEDEESISTTSSINENKLH